MSDCNTEPEGPIRTICAPDPPPLCARCNERPRQRLPGASERDSGASYDLCRECLNGIVKQPGRYGGAPSNGHRVFRTEKGAREATGQAGMSGD